MGHTLDEDSDDDSIVMRPVFVDGLVDPIYVTAIYQTVRNLQVWNKSTG